MIACTFCKDRPVLNATAWISINAPRYAPCPRCGRVYDDEGRELTRREPA